MRESKTEKQWDLFAGWCLWALVVLECVWHRSTWDTQCSQTLCFSFGQRFRHTYTHPPLQRQDRKAYVTSLCSFRSFLSPGQPFNTDSSILAGIWWREEGGTMIVIVEVRPRTDRSTAWSRESGPLTVWKEAVRRKNVCPLSLVLNPCWVQAEMLQGDWTEHTHHD